MTVKLVPNEDMQNALSELVQGRKILYVVCEPSATDTYNHNIKKIENLGNHKIRILCENNSLIYESIKEAATALGLDPGAVSKCVNGKQRTTGGYSFRKTIRDNK